ncbi:MAG TPA: xylulokinase [Spirochaetia bacterium]|nr:xylulokinase [Spirochaetia bacterium]
MEYFIGIDLGTSSVRVLALGEQGNVLAIQGRDYAILEPQPGFSEQSTAEWWDATSDCLQRLQGLDLLKNGRVRAVGLSGQMHGLVLLDREGNALRNAIIWPDRRTADICREWSQTIGAETISSIAGLPLATGFMAPSLAWVKRHEPEIYRKAAHALLPKDYIRYRLTGEIATDLTDASGSLLFDVARGSWSAQLLKSYDLDEHILPPVMNTAHIAGEVTASAAAATAIPPGTPVAAGGADIAMAALALGVDRPGTVVVSISTGGTVITGIDRPILDSRMHTLCSATSGRWILMGATLSAGLSLSWFARNVAVPLGASPDNVIDRISRDAQNVPAGSEGLLFAPYLCGERTPYMNPHAKGCFVGLSLRHSSAHMVRAIMEGVAFSLCESLDIFDALHVPASTVLCSGGGARSPLWRQILADTFDRPVSWDPSEEHSGIGAAMVAAMATGSPLTATSAGEPPSDVVQPQPEQVATYQKQRETFKHIHPQLAGIFEALA